MEFLLYNMKTLYIFNYLIIIMWYNNIGDIVEKI